MTIEAFSSSILFPLSRLRELEEAITFLMASQLPSGGWPVVIGGSAASTMATGQAVAALGSVKKLDGALARVDQVRLVNAVETGQTWLLKTQDHSGGWGVEPDTTAGQSPRTIATCYAAHAVAALQGGDTSYSPALKRAIEWYSRTQLGTGAWPDHPGGTESLGSTARVLSLLTRIKDPSQRALLKRGLQYLRSQRTLWKLGTETYVAQGAAGQTRFHFNILCDLGHALQDTQEQWSLSSLHEIAERALRSQNDDGSWPLFDFVARDTEICTWSTSEWLDFFFKRFESNPALLSDTMAAYANIRKRYKRLLAVVAVLVLTILLWPLSLVASVSGPLNDLWFALPEGVRTWVSIAAVVVMPTIILGIATNLMTPFVSQWWAWLRGVFK